MSEEEKLQQETVGEQISNEHTTYEAAGEQATRKQVTGEQATRKQAVCEQATGEQTAEEQATCKQTASEQTAHETAHEQTAPNHRAGSACVWAVCAGVIVFVLAVFLLNFVENTRTLENITGTYNMYEIQGENGTSHEEIKTLESAGFNLFINIDNNKTFHLIMLGSDFDGTWECGNGKNITFSPTLNSLDLTNATITGDTLTVTLFGEVTVFKQGAYKNPQDYL